MKIQALGPETVFQLIDLQLTSDEAADLLDKLEFIANTVADLQKEMEN